MAKRKVAVLFGGRSVEHGVSINSAKNIEMYLDKSQFELICIGISKSGTWHLTPSVSKEIEDHPRLKISLNPAAPELEASSGEKFIPDVVFPMLHGTDGEDGSIQGLLKAMDLPVVGTGVLGSAMSMSKLVSKQLLQQAGIPVSKYQYKWFSEKDGLRFEEIRDFLGLPFMVKSASLGSSVGVSKVKGENDFKKAVDEAYLYDECALFEAFIEGREIECAILGNHPPQASLPGEIVIGKDYEFYTFDAKYVDPDAVGIRVPANLTPQQIELIQKTSVAAYQALQCEDFARVDLFLTRDDKVYVNEINTIPGFTNSSMFPMMWKERGIDFSELISKLIHLALDRFAKAKRIQRDFESSLNF